jgi:hypothetical protein
MNVKVAVLALAMGVVGGGCASVNSFLDEAAERERLKWEPVATPVQLAYVMPGLAPQDERRQLQDGGGVSISVAVPTFEARVQKRAAFEALSPATSQAENREFMKTETPMVNVVPQHLAFNIKLNNKHDRVLRLAGTVVQVNVNGRMLSLAQENYRDFLAGMVLPRQESEFVIRGPALSELPDGAVIGLFLYDVITRTDAAGNATEKKNFEWYFTYKTEHRTLSENRVAQRVRMTQGEARTVGAEWPIAAPPAQRR